MTAPSFFPILPRLGSAVLRGAVHVYRSGISPFLPGSCRFHPTCSEYALDAIRAAGPCRGSVLAARRLFRCHPWGGSGYDPVPLRGDGGTHPPRPAAKP